MRKWRMTRRQAFGGTILLCFLMISIRFSPLVRQDACQGCHSHRLHLTFDARDVCSHVPSPLLAILVHSRPKSREKRDAIRRTWAAGANGRSGGATGLRHGAEKKNPKIVVVFLFGKSGDQNTDEKLAKESLEFGDVVQDDFVDTYRNVTLKAISGLAWATRFCADARFVAKVDDDVFLNVVNVVRYLENFRSDILVGGSCAWQRPRRNPFDKWYVSPFAYPHLNYPTYCHGFTILYSRSAACLVYAATRDVPFFRLDDVYLTGLVANRFLGLPITNIHGIFIDGVRNKDVCFQKDVVLSAHGSSGENLETDWKKVSEAECL